MNYTKTLVKGGFSFKRPFHQSQDDQQGKGGSSSHSQTTFKQIEWRKMIEVVELKDGRIKKLTNFPISLTPSTAAIDYISNQLSLEVPQFQGFEVVLLDNENYQIPDISTTKGQFSYHMFNHITTCVN